MRNLNEVIVDILMKSRFYEMANSLQRSKDVVDSLSLHIAEHLTKIILMPGNHRDQAHWRGEVQGALKKFRFKTFNNKPPTVDQYMEWFFVYGQDIDLDWASSGAIEDMLQSEYNTTVEFEPEEVLKYIRQIMRLCFEDLSIGKYPNINKVLEVQ